jgi:hypothetical protein
MTAPSIILEYDCDEIQAAMAVALLRLKNAHKLTYKDIGKVIGSRSTFAAAWVAGQRALLSEGWRVRGYDIEAHEYGEDRYPCRTRASERARDARL